MRILITGSNGLLGQKIVAQCLKRSHVFLATSKGLNRNPDCPDQYFESLDICDQQSIDSVFKQFQPTHVIHTAALTNVDYCELNWEECEEVNVSAVRKLFATCLKEHIHFSLLSTDFVFDGAKGNYSETDQVGPLSVYARSKVEAEKLLLNSTTDNWSIVRTIIVYGTGNNLSRSNIVLWARDSLREGKELHIVDDQFRAPTYVDDLAWACLEICRREKKGIFHISGPETMSVFELVQRIADYYGFRVVNLFPSKSVNLNQPAKRPPRTGFDLTKAALELGYHPHKLEDTLDLF
jgi:dTDP-4-dehydrorhamnose reductase